MELIYRKVHKHSLFDHIDLPREIFRVGKYKVSVRLYEEGIMESPYSCSWSIAFFKPKQDGDFAMMGRPLDGLSEREKDLLVLNFNEKYGGLGL